MRKPTIDWDMTRNAVRIWWPEKKSDYDSSIIQEYANGELVIDVDKKNRVIGIEFMEGKKK